MEVGVRDEICTETRLVLNSFAILSILQANQMSGKGSAS